MTAPLRKVRVLDFGWVLAGAIPGHLLADLGADVIKVESRTRLDYMRQGRPIIGTERDPEQNPMFHSVNRNKRSLTVNLAHPQGGELLASLAEKSDIVIENFSPGVMQRHDLGYEDLSRRNPRLVYLSMSAAGQSGPLRDIRAYATIIAALAGIDSLVGYAGEAPIGLQSSFADINAALYGVALVLAALHQRDQTGQGQHIDLSQLEAAVTTVADQLARVDTQDVENGPPFPGGHYPCQGNDQWVAISVCDQNEYETLGALIGVAPEPDASASHSADDVERAIGAWTAERSKEDSARELQRQGIAAAPLLDIEDRFLSDHFRERGIYVEQRHPVLGQEWIYALPWRSNLFEPDYDRAPLLGEHTDEILTELLGLDVSEIEDLRVAGAVE